MPVLFAPVIECHHWISVCAWAADANSAAAAAAAITLNFIESSSEA
jgi:hypothetical protein